MGNIEQDIAHIDNLEGAEDVTQFVIDFLKGRGAAYTTRIARQLEQRKNVRFLYNNSTLIVQPKSGAGLSVRTAQVLERHAHRIIDEWEDEYGYKTQLDKYQQDYLMKRVMLNLPLGVLDDGTILRLQPHEGRFYSDELKLLDRLQYFAR